MQLHLAISPCPNDIYIYAGIILGHVVVREGYTVHTSFHDIETLNEMAVESSWDALKLSAARYTYLQKDLTLLPCGGAMGYGCGPLLVRNNRVSPASLASPSLPEPVELDTLSQNESPLPLQPLGKVENRLNSNYGKTKLLENVIQSPGSATLKVWVPGKFTTAAGLLKFYNPQALCEFMRFELLYTYLLKHPGETGVIIHENRFTWQRDGLELICDLGAYWESQTTCPIPLGVAVVKDKNAFGAWAQAIRASLQWSRENENQVLELCSHYAQETEIAVVQKHIKTFVNDFSWDIGQKGQEALNVLGYHLKGSE